MADQRSLCLHGHRPMLTLERVDASQVVNGFVTWSTSCLDCGAWYQITAKAEPVAVTPVALRPSRQVSA